jgi:hypothetical protein
MKHRILAFLCSIAAALTASAQVPSLINYQGRLTDSNGAPVTGNKNFAISIYDAATGGNLLYEETIGAVTLDANGVYSFQFGSAGTSNTIVSEIIATTNGTSTTFQKVLANSPVVSGSVSVADGNYTWNQSTGSSNEDDFGVAYSNSLRRVTVNYYAGAPTSGQSITATYRYGTSGITGALSSGAEHWMAVSVNGVVQASRQRVLAVPFANRAVFSATAESLTEQVRLWRPAALISTGVNDGGKPGWVLPMGCDYGRVGGGSNTTEAVIPANFKSISKIDFDIFIGFNPELIYRSSASFSIVRYKADVPEEVLVTYSRTSSSESNGRFRSSHPATIILDQNYVYKLRLSTSRDQAGLPVEITDIKLTVTE